MENENKTLEILVIEDDIRHLNSAKSFFESERERLQEMVDLRVDYVSTGEAAIKNLSEKHYDGIMSDLHFPYHEGDEPKQNGINIGVNYAKPKGIPIVFVSDLDVHRDAHDLLMMAYSEFGGRNIYNYVEVKKYDDNNVKEDWTKSQRELYDSGKKRAEKLRKESEDFLKKYPNFKEQTKPFKVAFVGLMYAIESKGKEYYGCNYGYPEANRINGIQDICDQFNSSLKDESRREPKDFIEKMLKYADFK